MKKRAGGSSSRRLTVQQETAVRVQRAALERARAAAAAEREAVAAAAEVARPLGHVDLHQLAGKARSARARADSQERAVVRLGRELGVSWDRIGSLLGLSGETLRRRHGSGQPDGA